MDFQLYECKIRQLFRRKQKEDGVLKVESREGSKLLVTYRAECLMGQILNKTVNNILVLL